MHFDLGGIMKIRPGDIERDGDLWTLHPWTGDITAGKPDGTVEVSERNDE